MSRQPRPLGRWGFVGQGGNVPEHGWQFLRDRVGPPGQPLADPPGGPIGDVAVSRLADPDTAALRNCVSRDGFADDAAARAQHRMGASLVDYLLVRTGQAPPAPDAIVAPSSHDEVAAVLRVCGERGISVVPFGGGTSVVGGLDYRADGPWVSLDLARMDRVGPLDPISGTVVVEPGVTGPALERWLGARGFTWGHLPQSWERATIGGYLATRSSGQASAGYGRSDSTVQRLCVATPTSTLDLGRGPGSAAGPDLRQVFVGSEGAFGVITSATLRVRRLPRYRRYEAAVLPDFLSGVTAFRQLTQAGLQASVMRLSDPSETAVTLTMSGPQGRSAKALAEYLRLRGISAGCLVILGWEGRSPAATRARRAAAWRVLRHHGAVGLGKGPGRSWQRHRFEGPYLRDDLLDGGYLVETLETAADYSDLLDLKANVEAALTVTLGDTAGGSYLMCHVSHVYETGASLYFTAIAPRPVDGVAAWQQAKAAATDAIVASGGTITHHHAVGRDHRPWLADEVGEAGIGVLDAVKRHVDPAAVMNPGALLDNPRTDPDT